MGPLTLPEQDGKIGALFTSSCGEAERALSAPMDSLLPSGNTPYARVAHLGDAVP